VTDRRFRLMQLEAIARTWDEKAAAAEAADERWAWQWRRAATRARQIYEEAANAASLRPLRRLTVGSIRRFAKVGYSPLGTRHRALGGQVGMSPAPASRPLYCPQRSLRNLKPVRN
jgi:hypothetical protein